MRKMKLALVVLAAIMANVSNADDVKPQVIRYDLTSAYLPEGFDNNDKVQFVVGGNLPNTCYKTGPLTVEVNKFSKRIVVKQRVYRYNTVCLYMIVPFHKVVDVGVLPLGNYTIVNEKGNTLGRLPVRKTQNPAADDFLYAPVSEAQVKSNEAGEQYLSLEGTFSDSCARIKTVKVFKDGKNVITVLPISEKQNTANCEPGNFPFSEAVALPKLDEGKYLLHIRALNGEALFRFFDVFAWE